MPLLEKKSTGKKRGGLTVVYFSFIIITVLAGMFFWLKNRHQPPISKKTNWELLRKITIQPEKGDAVILEKKDSRWLVASLGNLPADANKVSELIDFLKSFDRRELVSQNKGKLALFDLEKEKPVITVELEQQPSFSFIPGKASFGRNGTYFRFSSQNDVYLAPARETSFSADTHWENLRILEAVSLDTKKMTVNMDVNRKKSSLSLEKDEQGEWKSNGETVDKEKVTALLSQLNYLEAEKVASGPASFGTAIEINLTDGQNTETKILISGEKESLVTRQNANEVYTLAAETYRAIQEKAVALFLKK